MLRASETLKAKSCSILRQLLKQYHPLVAHSLNPCGCLSLFDKDNIPV